jgi:hypothetical protein
MTPLQDWKTTAAGVTLIIVAIALLFRVVTFNEFLTALAFLLGGGGLVAAKDSGVQPKDPSQS